MLYLSCKAEFRRRGQGDFAPAKRERTVQKTSVIKIITAAAVTFIVLLAAALILNVVKLSALHKRERELKARMAELDRQIAESREMSDFVSTDEYIDRYAREYLNMQGKDEEAFTGRE